MPNQPLTIDAVNRMDEVAFVASFGDIAEHSPWVARAAFAEAPFADHAALVAAFHHAIESAPHDAQLALLREHPDLAGKAAIAGTLAPESYNEQTGAGLDRMTAEEFALFTALNNRYRARHGIPFIRAVKGSTKAQIIAAFQERVENEPEVEFATALTQVGRIIRFRLEDRVAA
ncbi:2-oxo-4-hydroxy-4-carboxy-5-ureidoimidazoline decarboxylase [Kaistia dalseonensis]|uniref:2-oxo-4-hydroxy-4-carboxy-5-ureidoimidazoline decarboxylase n=1 Tax=Kaistia dalseonensis TaxID=410840 RepID=A0ABU0H2L8_9HYPH|nr:2-oxo-4-hydroxy-4-carboxy-5-ureidoimidazoline decarboxylase [Kaistia dalseonensis]MCX5493978.1 2-oxo-4-hydroxy-4-carboxy-5-ureidoimidazoline decarboxylase [Kaistia dalseonensis]MDQ0436554.1 2-oxo-4-hydroxy-4-carboxy-5-ureidoimidazoline decarboxylase [Kaistia dalseonensis]